MLAKGKAVTTVQEGGDVVRFTDTDQIIGRVIDVDNSCEYSDFDVELD